MSVAVLLALEKFANVGLLVSASVKNTPFNTPRLFAVVFPDFRITPSAVNCTIDACEINAEEAATEYSPSPALLSV
jgi:hypothetical protein